MPKEATYRGKKVILERPMRSTRPEKKKMVYVQDPSTKKVKVIHYGQRGYRHNYSETGWRNYRNRAEGIRDKDGRLTKNNKLSANYWAIRDLWPGRKGWKR